MELGLVRRIDIDAEMQQAYLDYAMSVIVARALPDARDGLKPVHRRILYAMYDMGLRPDSPYKKSARIVGEVLGKYHPHGDMAVYEAMARMAQDFSMRCLLVDGQGNFGSVDGDPPAAMRYTEARLTAPAIHMLADIQKNTVDFEANFDGSLTEPGVLPSAIPNLLVNGATGIAVGMSTSIPPHNLAEVIDALKYLLGNWERMDDIGLEDLMRFIQGPDFPTGGVIIHEEGEGSLASAYGSGRGRMTVQARAHLEEMERGRNRIIVTELPYMTNKSSLIERIAELAREGRLEGLADLRDESDRQGMRIVIELVKTADPEAVLRDLYKHTPMQSTFSLIMLALVGGEPRLLTLKQVLRVYLDHRLEIVRRRSQFDLEKARQRAHILEGLRVALKNLDAVIEMIRKAPDVETARARLMKRFRLSEIQAQAILDMQLRRLAALERKKIEDEYKETLASIKELEGLLRSPKKMRQLVADELQAVKDTYGDRRRTQIARIQEGEQRRAMLTIEDLSPEKAAWLVVTTEGLISRTLEDKLPRLSGGEAPAWLLRVNTRHTLFLANDQGDTAAIPVLAVPETDIPAEGLPYDKLSALTGADRLAAVFTLPPKGERSEDWKVLTATRQGMVKKTAVSDLPGPSASTFTLVKVNEGDRLGWVRMTDGKSQVLLLTAQGMAIRFSEDEVRPMGLVAAGVIAMKLQAGDEVAGLDILPQPGEVFMVASDGSAKRVAVTQFPKQGRYGQGVLAWKLPEKVRVVGMTVGRGAQRITLHLSKLAPKVMRLDATPLKSRVARGARILELKNGEQVVSLTVPWDVEQPLASIEISSKLVPDSGEEVTIETGAEATLRAHAKRRVKVRAEAPKRTGTKRAAKAATRVPVKPRAITTPGLSPQAGMKTGAEITTQARVEAPIETGTRKITKSGVKATEKRGARAPRKTGVIAAKKTGVRTAAKAGAKAGTRRTAKSGAETTSKPSASMTKMSGVGTTTRRGTGTTAKPGAKTRAKTSAKRGAKTTTKTGTRTTAKTGAKTRAKASAKTSARRTTKTGTKSIAKTSVKAPVKTKKVTTAKTGTRRSAKTGLKTSAQADTRRSTKTSAKRTTKTGAKSSRTKSGSKTGTARSAPRRRSPAKS